MGIRRGEVIEVYNDLTILTEDKIEQLIGRSIESDFLPSLSSAPEIVKNMPRDSLRVRLLGDDFSIICYPFFPSHLRLPTKVGEFVWVFLESLEMTSQSMFDPEQGSSRSRIKDVVMSARNPNAQPKENNILGFWMCRPTSERQVEDLNYTAFGRSKYASGFSMESASDVQKNSSRTSRTPTFPYFTESVDNADRVEKDDSLLKQRMDGFFNSFDMEPVARFTKMPGDTVIAGSHDSRIVLGQARAGRPATLGVDNGAVDIVAGTGKSSTAPNLVSNALGRQEVDKDPLLTNKQDVSSEGDPDFASDASRLIVAENLDVDGSFSLSFDATGSTDTSSKTGPSIAAKSQHVRLIASSDGSARILVEGPTKSSIVIDAQGNIQIDAGAAVNVRSPSVLMTSAAGSGATATSVIIETTTGFQTQLATALTEIAAGLTAFGIPLPTTFNLIAALQAKKFSSLITRSD